jgi:dTDP-4-dehydrorhamnose 3,5-epimerase-like enzyme
MTFERGETGANFEKKTLIPHPNGDVRHIHRSLIGGQLPYLEIYFSEIHSKTIKGWKIHKTQTQNICVAFGRIEIICISKAKIDYVYQKFSVNSTTNHGIVTIPPNIFYSLVNNSDDKVVLLNAVDIPHDPDEGKSLPFDHVEFQPLTSNLGYENEI